MRSYLMLCLGLCLTLSVGCSDSDGTGGTGGGTGGTGGAGGDTGMGGGEGGGGGDGGSDGTTIEKELSLGCANSSPIGAQSILSATLEVTAGTITGGEEFDAVLAGTAGFPESFLDAAQALVPGGLSQAIVADAKYVAQVRSGASVDAGEDAGTVLLPDGENLEPGATRLCNFPTDQVCAADDECAGGVCNDPVLIVDVPISDDCDPDGVCDGLGKLEGETSQCALNGYCVTGALVVPLLPVTSSYMADASGAVLVGWADRGLSYNTFDEDTQLYTIPKPNASEPIEQGLKVNAGLVVSVECVMGVDEGVDPEDEENDLVGYTSDEELISFPIE